MFKLSKTRLAKFDLNTLPLVTLIIVGISFILSVVLLSFSQAGSAHSRVNVLGRQILAIELQEYLKTEPPLKENISECIFLLNEHREAFRKLAEYDKNH